MSSPSPAAGISLIAPPALPEFKAGDDIAALTAHALETAGAPLRDGDVVVFAQKVVSKVEGRVVELSSVAPSEEAKRLADIAQKDPRVVELMLQESSSVMRCVPGVIILRHRLGYVMASAGIDQSNLPGAGERVLLLPLDPDASAQRLREALQSAAGVNLAVVINDSFGRPWRNGTCGVALGSAGLVALRDQRGQTDRQGRILQATEVAVADEVAAAASLLMGQAAEGRPIAVLRGLAPELLGGGRAADLIRTQRDLFT